MTEHKWRDLGTNIVPGLSVDVVIYADDKGIAQITYEVLSRILRELGWIEQPEEAAP